MSKELDQDELKEIKARFNLAQEAWDKQWKQSMADLKFCDNESQWPTEVKQSRAGRPTYAADRTQAQVKSIVNAQRENRPAVSIHPINDGADKETAEIIQGICRHIEVQSDADMAYDQAFEDAVRCGIGFWRIITEYESDSFDQNIKVESIINPFSVLIDPNFKRIDGSDIQWAFIIDSLTEDEYKEQYPKSKLSEYKSSMWNGLNKRDPEWFSNNGKICTVAEYFCIKNEKKTICKMADGSIKDKSELSIEEKPFIVLERDTTIPVINWKKLNGIEILEETTWPGTKIPIIPVFGDALLLDGQRMYSGLVHNIKEEQMMLNVAKSTAIELIAAAPKTPWVGPAGFVGDRKADWQDVNVRNLAYLEYESIDDLGNPLPPPQRNIAEPPIQGILEIMNSIEMDIKSTNNMYDPSLGQKISNQSGVAVKALQAAGSTGNYHFSDNLSRAIRLEGYIFLDLIPKIYSEQRVIRIVGLDDKHSLVTVNGPDPSGKVAKVYDLTVGKYDVTVQSGPSYQTKRQENTAILFDLAGKDPQLMSIAGDIIVSQLDSPIATQLQERLEKALPPQLQPTENDEALPPEVVQRLQQDQAIIQKLTQTLQQETELANKLKSGEDTKLQIAKMNNETELLKVQATIDAKQAELGIIAQIKSLEAKQAQYHDMLKTVQDHIHTKDQMMLKSKLDADHEAMDHTFAKDQLTHEADQKIKTALATNAMNPPELLNPKEGEV